MESLGEIFIMCVSEHDNLVFLKLTKSKDKFATCKIVSDGFYYVQKNSDVRPDVVPSFKTQHGDYYSLRQDLIKNNIIDSSIWKFTKEQRFKNLTEAEAVINGSAGSPKNWKSVPDFQRMKPSIQDMSTIYNRESTLQENLNTFLETYLKLPKQDYYSNLDIKGFLQLKSVISDINNILTMRLSLSFSDWIVGKLNFDFSTKDDIENQLSITKPNTNGYDIESNVSGKLIAEVKCIIPINGGNLYGSDQKNGIIKDIKNLFGGKCKGSKKSPNLFDEYFKFMVFLDTPEIRMATEHLVKNIHLKNLNIKFFEEGNHVPSTDSVYIVFIEI